MRKAILLTLLALALTSCAEANFPEYQSFPNAAQLPTLLPSTTAPNSLASTAMTPPPVFGTAPTQVPPTFLYTPIPTQTQITPPPTATIPPGTPKPEDYEIKVLHMVDGQNGWAVFTIDNRRYIANHWLGRTTDGGHTWINVTPPGIEALRSDNGNNDDWGYLGIFPVDSETAWAYTSCTGWPLCDVPSATWRTEDGGRSWKTIPAPTECLDWRLGCIPAEVKFINQEYGWTLMKLYGRHYIDYDLYLTLDGGTTWDKLPRQYLFGGPANIIYTLDFVDTKFGVKWPTWPVNVIVDEVINGNFSSLEATRNSGYSWNPVNLPAPSDFEETAKALGSALEEGVWVEFIFEDLPTEQSAVYLLTSFSQERYGTPFFQAYYFSDDEGRSWHALSRVGESFFLDDATGWRVASTDPPGLEQTDDGGASWEVFPQEAWELDKDPEDAYIVHITDGGATRAEIETKFLDERLWPGQVVRLESMHMDTATEGWGVEAGGATLCTEDGAKTWQVCPSPAEDPVLAEVDLPLTERNWVPDEPFPEELFHGEPVPARMQVEIDRSRQFQDEINEYYNPFSYYCASVNIDQMMDDPTGVSWRCHIFYPIGSHPDLGFEFGYWIYYYYELFENDESRVWPHVVSMDFIDEQLGWRLVDLQTGMFQLEKTEDNGETWSEVKQVAWTGDLEFVDSMEGWAIARQPLERGVPDYYYIEDLFRPAVLLHTTNSGRTWQEVQTVIGS